MELRSGVVRIIDVGGTVSFWEQRKWSGRDDIQITLVNLSPQTSRYENIVPVVADATDLSRFDDCSFDVAFSNSVIEHLGSYENQAAMGREMQRVASAFWLQTPNFWFPIEPHFLVPGWQWLPFRLRVEILRRFDCGWRARTRDYTRARHLVAEIRLMKRSELARIFPNATLVRERFGLLTKSWIAYGGF